MSGTIAVQIVSVFAIMFVGITVAALWFAHSSSKVESKNELKKNEIELKKKEMDILDKHFQEIVRIECPYCKTLYSSSILDCPGCGANTKKIIFPEMPK